LDGVWRQFTRAAVMTGVLNAAMDVEASCLELLLPDREKREERLSQLCPDAGVVEIELDFPFEDQFLTGDQVRGVRIVFQLPPVSITSRVADHVTGVTGAHAAVTLPVTKLALQGELNCCLGDSLTSSVCCHVPGHWVVARESVVCL
jgi:hypothetical protein